MKISTSYAAVARRFPRIRLAGLAVFAFLLAGIMPAPPARAQTDGDANGPPRLQPETTILHAGTVIQGESVEVEFVLHNRGGEPLKILRAKPG